MNSGELGALVALVNQERSGEAEAAVRTLLAREPDAGPLWKILGVALMRQGKDALPALRRTAQLLPRDTEAHGNLALALQHRGQWAQALESWQRVLALAPKDAEALVAAGNAARALGRPREAVALYLRALKESPRHLEAHNNLGNALTELGRYDDAVGSYRFALRIAPDQPEVLCNMANTLRLAGFLEASLATGQRSLAADPQSSVAYNNLGLVQVALGRRDEAVASYRRALRLRPDYAEAMTNLGNVLRDLGERQEAAGLYTRALELDPQPETQCNLGNVLFEMRRTAEAAACYLHALALRPGHAPAHLSLGTVLRLQRRPAEAEASVRSALAVDPNYVEALALLGELCADQGRFGEAETLFRRALALKPDFAPALVSLATHRRMGEDAAWLHNAQALLTTALPLGQEINLRFALGKYFDDIERYPDAFDHYRRANELTRRSSPPYDAAILTRRVDDILGTFSAAFIGSCVVRSSSSELPVFVIGMPRSGTSLAEQILASHPAVFGAGEVTFWDAAFRALIKPPAAGATGATGAAGGAAAGAASAGEAPVVPLDPELIRGMAHDYVERQRAVAGGAERVVDKMPANFMYAGLIHAAFPRARIIHMRRHPLDTCLSIYFQNFFNMGPYANDLEHLAAYYDEYLRVTEHWRCVLPASALLEVPYEGLIEDQERWSRRMLEFIGLPWDPRCLEFHKTDRVVITASRWQVRQKIHASSVGRWKHYEQFLGPLLRLGAENKSRTR